MSNKFLSIEDEKEIREAVLDLSRSSARDVPNAKVEVLLRELDYLRNKSKVDGDVYNSGRFEGRADIAAALRNIIDPKDEKHLNLDGILKEVQRLNLNET